MRILVSQPSSYLDDYLPTGKELYYEQFHTEQSTWVVIDLNGELDGYNLELGCTLILLELFAARFVLFNGVCEQHWDLKFLNS